MSETTQEFYDLISDKCFLEEHRIFKVYHAPPQEWKPQQNFLDNPEIIYSDKFDSYFHMEEFFGTEELFPPLENSKIEQELQEIEKRYFLLDEENRLLKDRYERLNEECSQKAFRNYQTIFEDAIENINEDFDSI